MKIACSIYKNSDLIKLVGHINTAVLMVPHLSYVYENDFDVEKAISFCEQNSIEIIIGINRVFLERELDLLEESMKRFCKYKMLVSDVGALQIAKELKIESNIIYDPDTLICNKLELSLYQSFGYDAIAMSNEITLEDVIESYRETKAPAFYQVFGRKLMFYSKRKLIDIYKQYSGYDFGNKNLSLVEYMRDYHTPLVYNDEGFFVFRQYCISLLDSIDKLSFLKYAYIETITLKDEETMKVVNILEKAINGQDVKADLSGLDLPIEDGFTYKDTAYIKEKSL